MLESGKGIDGMFFVYPPNLHEWCMTSNLSGCARRPLIAVQGSGGSAYQIGRKTSPPH